VDIHHPALLVASLAVGAWEAITLVIDGQDGGAAAFPSVLALVRSGAASEHDESGDHALAGGAESSDRRTRLSQANADWPYFADFVCLARKIVVEADGRTHETAEANVRDAERDEWFRGAGFRVLRFPDELIIGGLPIVTERIRAALRET
jgi:hypothetical protein